MDEKSKRPDCDVGANIGQFAQQIHAILPEAAIYSFEPLLACYEQLLRNMGHVPKFRAFNFALGSEATETNIHKAEFTPSSSIPRMRNYINNPSRSQPKQALKRLPLSGLMM